MSAYIHFLRKILCFPVRQSEKCSRKLYKDPQPNAATRRQAMLASGEAAELAKEKEKAQMHDVMDSNRKSRCMVEMGLSLIT